MLKILLIIAVFICIQNAQVHILTDGNYTEFIQQHRYVFVKYYAPWCGHCKAMIPEYNKLAKLVTNTQFVIAKVDCTTNQAIAEEVGVQSYPTLKLFINGLALEYDGQQRKANAIFKWINKFVNIKVPVITREEIPALAAQNNILVIEGEDDKEKILFEAASVLTSEAKFYFLKSQDKKITLYLKNGITVSYKGLLNWALFTAWIHKETLPTVIPLNSTKNHQFIISNADKRPTLVYLNIDQNSEVIKRIQNYCNSHKEIMCAFAVPEDIEFDQMSRLLQYQKSQGSRIYYLQNQLTIAYIYPNSLGDLTEQSLEQFINDVNNGKIEKILDRNIKKQIQYKNVLILTNTTYQKTIDQNKFVFVQYYSNHCGHCVYFAPEYQKLAINIKEHAIPFLITAVDVGTETDIRQSARIKGFPTLRIFISGQEINYDEKRDIEVIQNYLKELSASKLLIAPTINDVRTPAVTVSGIEDNSIYEALPALFNTYPSYRVIKEETFSIKIHNEKGVSQYQGENKISQIIDWLESKTQKLLVDVGESVPSKKLTKAVKKRIPILFVMNRGNRQDADSTIKFLQEYCLDKTNFVCGFAHKGDPDFEGLDKFLEDPWTDKNRLIYLKTAGYQRYLYEGDTNSLKAEELTNFINKIQNNEIQAHDVEEEVIDEEAEVQSNQQL